MKDKKTQNSSTWLWIVAVLALGALAWISIRVTDRPVQTSQTESMARLPTLSPSLFTGKTREAYQAAMDVPEVLEKMPCYCGCDRNAGHRSNLDCYIDDHAVG